jgi:quinol monooxygenase YgiN
VDFYAEDVVFDKGKDDGILKGRQAIADWYRKIWEDLAETVTPQVVAIDSAQNSMMVELRTALTATRDGVQRPNMTLNKGDRLVVDGAVVYTLKDGLITSLRGVSTARDAQRVSEERPPAGAEIEAGRKVVLISRIKARPGRGNELESAIREFYLKVREAEPGCLVNVMHRPAPPPGRGEGSGGFALSSAQADTFIFYEVYADAAAAAGHTRTPHFQVLMKKLEGVIDGKIELEFLDEIAAR